MKTIILVIVTAILSGCVTVTEEKKPLKTQVSMANPASVYCQEHGGKSTLMKSSDGSMKGYCLFKGGAMCEEWAFFRGECRPVETDPLK